MTKRLYLALCELAGMTYPSVPKLLRGRGFGFEADRVQEVMDAFEVARQVKPEEEE